MQFSDANRSDAPVHITEQHTIEDEQTLSIWPVYALCAGKREKGKTSNPTLFSIQGASSREKLPWQIACVVGRANKKHSGRVFYPDRMCNDKKCTV